MLAVLFYHAAGVLPGGFAGVDVFFVISGYVITTSIVGELGYGRFTIAGFYERRVRRIAPALVATVLLTAAAASAILLPSDLVAFGKSAVAATLMGSNLLFWLEAGYFDAAAQSKPLLHTWSLGIEEQFYLLYPLLLALLWRRARGALVPILAMLAALSFAAGVWMTAHNPSTAFYLAPFRFWELLIGALIALSPLQRLQGAPTAIAGLAMIAAAYALFGEATPFPGVAALLPTAGAALVIVGAQTGSPAARLLGCLPLSFVGRISYSLYLIHWPLIVLVEYRQGAALGPWQAAAVIVVSIGLAALSWRLVEQPVRRSRSIGRVSVFGAGFAAAFGLCLIGAGLVAARGLPARLPTDVASAYAARADRWKDESRCLIDGAARAKTTPADIRAGRLCAFGKTAEGRPPDFMIWGDSHAAAMAPAILAAADRAGAYGVFVAQASCAPLRRFETVSVRSVERKAWCAETNAAILDYLRNHPVGMVFMVARWPKYAAGHEYGKEGILFDPAGVKPAVPGEDTKLAKALNDTLAELRGLGVTPVLVMGVPEPGYDIPYAVAKARIGRTSTEAIGPTRAALAARQTPALKVLETAARNHDAVIVDPTPALCDATRCAVERDGNPLYSDADHLSTHGALAISPIFDDAFKMLKARQMGSR